MAAGSDSGRGLATMRGPHAGVIRAAARPRHGWPPCQGAHHGAVDPDVLQVLAHLQFDPFAGLTGIPARHGLGDQDRRFVAVPVCQIDGRTGNPRVGLSVELRVLDQPVGKGGNQSSARRRNSPSGSASDSSRMRLVVGQTEYTASCASRLLSSCCLASSTRAMSSGSSRRRTAVSASQASMACRTPLWGRPQLRRARRAQLVVGAPPHGLVRRTRQEESLCGTTLGDQLDDHRFV